jgi:hypothetical protein
LIAQGTQPMQEQRMLTDVNGGHRGFPPRPLLAFASYSACSFAFARHSRERQAASGDRPSRGQYDLANLHGRERLAMAPEAALILTALEVLDVGLRRRKIDDLADNASAGYRRLTDLGVSILGQEQHPTEFDISADLHVAEIDVHDIAFLDPILTRTIFKNCVHVDSVLLMNPEHSDIDERLL